MGLFLEVLMWVFVEGTHLLLYKLKKAVKPPLLKALNKWNRKQVEAARKS